MKSYMKDRRREVESWIIGDDENGAIIEPGWWADEVLKIMPRDTMICKPIVIGKDDDGLVVEWCYSKVVFTLARAKKYFKAMGKVEVYAVQKIEEIIPKSEVKNVEQ